MTETPQTQSIKIFYSWQSDSDRNTNQRAIRNALEKAQDVVNKEDKYNLTIDEATRETPGSDDITKTILEKIRHSHIFVADVSLINSNDAASPRKTPNPNVIYELGYATALLGAQRVVLIFNTASGKTEDLPFDIRGRRISTYVLREKNDKENIKKLEGLALTAVETILSSDPRRPFLIPSDREQKRMHNEDKAVLRMVLPLINRVSINNLIENLPTHVGYDCVNFQEIFHEAWIKRKFYLNDETLHALLDKVDFVWHELLSLTTSTHGYSHRPNARHYVWNANSDMRFAHEIETRILELARELSRDVDALFQYVHKNFRINMMQLIKVWNDGIVKYWQESDLL